MRAYGPNRLRTAHGKGVGGWKCSAFFFFLLYLEAYHSAGEVLVLSALLLPFFNSTVVHEVADGGSTRWTHPGWMM